jgi:hypothetical protein
VAQLNLPGTTDQRDQRRVAHSVVLDLAATDLPLHSTQDSRFFHGYYGHYCYLPLYSMSGNQEASAGSWKELGNGLK